MSFDGIRVTHASLIEGADSMKAGVDAIDARLEALERELQLLRSDWSGHQQTAYQEAKRTWDTAIGEMRLLLLQTQQAVRCSQQDYAQADADGARRFA